MSISTKNSVNSEHDPLQQPISSNNYQTIPETTPKSLPPDREERRPLLSPDDPSVSPLNVRNVRICRFILGAIINLSLVWLVLLLISDFVSVPGFDNRGRGFIEIDLILLSLFANASTLCFFTIPSKLERSLDMAIAGIVTFDLLIMLLYRRFLHDRGGLGFATMLWLVASLSFGAVSDYLVEEAKNHEEIRLTGRVESRKTVYEFFAVATRVTLRLITFVLVLLLSLNFWFQAYDFKTKPWGKLIPVGDSQLELHLACFGDVYSNKSFTPEELMFGDVSISSSKDEQPIILVEGGQFVSSEEASEWVEELFHLDKVQRYCVYDHPGTAFSNSFPSPVSLGIVADLLYEALSKEKIYGPFVLVGYDIGGLYSRIFASRHASQVHSMVLVEAWSQSLLKPNPFANDREKNGKTKLEDLHKTTGIRRMNAKTGLYFWWKGIYAPFSLKRLRRFLVHRHGPEDRIFGKDITVNDKFWRFKLQEQISSSLISYQEVTNSLLETNGIPIAVASSDVMIKKSVNWGRWQRELTKISSKPIEWVITKGNHRPWDDPNGRKQLQDLLLRVIDEE
ncbi:hypothetical protein LJB42_002768 [Komagataella kurtzmanii]|nr:hypothetical protein LJB42_002768 [Komagataella kurtzmanii]